MTHADVIVMTNPRAGNENRGLHLAASPEIKHFLNNLKENSSLRVEYPSGGGLGGHEYMTAGRV